MKGVLNFELLSLLRRYVRPVYARKNDQRLNVCGLRKHIERINGNYVVTKLFGICLFQ